MIIPANLKGKDLYDFVVKNEALIIYNKKSAIKQTDAFMAANLFVNSKGETNNKSAVNITQPTDTTKLNLSVVINTTNYLDSHHDVHIPSIWNKTLSDNKKGFYLLNAHQAKFEDVIGEGMAGTVKQMMWADLGYNYVGNTEALILSGVIDEKRNPFMFSQYKNNYVKQHSVGMQYVKVVTCIDDKDYPVQKENWDKYYPMVVNKDDLDGMFWAVLEAKLVEGSAVLFGSNDCTPVMGISKVEDETNEDENEDENSTEDEEPQDSTLNQPQEKSFSDLIKETKFIKINS